MKVISIVGNSGSGKTRLLKLLISELKKRGMSVAVIKHCAHGIDFNQEDKDSARLLQSGAHGVALASPGELAVLQKNEDELDFQTIAARYFLAADLVFVEGGRKNKTIPKIEVLGKGISGKVKCSAEELLAVISDFKVLTDKPLFLPDQISKISDFLEKIVKERKPGVILECDGEPIPLNNFVQKVMENSVMALVHSLDGIKENPKNVSLTLRKR